jgi:DNA replication and repair protein RecF
MSIEQLDIYALRNIQTLRFSPHPRWNVIFGENGTGKTSLLEALSLVSTGRSFRTRDISALISYDESTLTLFTRTCSGNTVSVKKNKAEMQVWINQKPCSKRSELVQLLPCQLFYQDIFSVIDAGPAFRRTVLDWGLFHVKHDMASLWKEYTRVIKQRNSLLRQQASKGHVKPWDFLLEELSEQLHLEREKFCLQWFELFKETLPKLTLQECLLTYEKGWDRKKTGRRLLDILDEQWDMDRMRQYTHSGAHQADLILSTPTLKVRQSLSRGQQKMILLALKLSQAQLVSKACLYLFDDVFSELDLNHSQRLLDCINELPGQFFFTCTQPDVFYRYLNSASASFFSMKYGQLMQEP